MKVRLLTLYAGPLGAFQPDSIADFSEEEGAALVAGGYAIAVDVPSIESAVVDAPAESAVVDIKPKGRKK